MSSGGNFLDTLLEVGVRVQDNGTTQPAEGTINFIGFTVADDPSNGRTNVTNPAGAFAFGLDLASVTSTQQHVVGWYGEPLDQATMGAPGNAYLPLYSGTSAEWKAVAMSGDVAITAAGATTVDAIQGVAISGAASTSYALIATGTNAAHWAAQTSSGITALTGDVTASGTGSVAATVVQLTGSGGAVTVPSATHLSFPDGSAHVAATGRIRLSNGDAIVSRNFGNTLDANLVSFDSGATLSVGQASGTGVAVVSIQGNVTQMYFGSGSSYLDCGPLNFRGSAHSGAVILDVDTSPHAPTFISGASTTTFTIGTNAASAALILQADAATTIQTLASTGTELANLTTPAAGTGPRIFGSSGRTGQVASTGHITLLPG